MALGLFTAGFVAPARGAEVVAPASLDSALGLPRDSRGVDYGRLARESGPLRRWLRASEEARLEGHSREERLAFWIDVYDARVLDGVLRRPGIRSVMDDLPGRAPFFRETFLAAGGTWTLDSLETHVLRRSGEPRVHFVLHCASRDCPELPRRALRGASLDRALEEATSRFVRDARRNRVTADGVLELSAIFDWYGEDFRAGGSTAVGFVRRYRRDVPAGARVRFLPYDWALGGHW